MNCQEYRNLIEDALDVSLHDEPERRVRLHLEHCASCRDYFKLRRDEHIALFSRINLAYEELHLPDGFADRLAESVRNRRSARRGWRRLALRKWALIAASLVAMAGFVFAASVAVEALWGDDSDETEVAAAVPSVAYAPVFSFDPLIQDIDNQLENNQKGETLMSKVKAAAAALSAAMTAAPLAAVSGDEYQFIISGDPVAAETVGSSSDYSDTTSLTVGMLADGIVCDSEFEARSRTTDESATGPLRSDEFNGMIILIK